MTKTSRRTTRRRVLVARGDAAVAEAPGHAGRRGRSRGGRRGRRSRSVTTIVIAAETSSPWSSQKVGSAPSCASGSTRATCETASVIVANLSAPEPAGGAQDRPTRAVLLDALGTLVELEPPWVGLREALGDDIDDERLVRGGQGGDGLLQAARARGPRPRVARRPARPLRRGALARARAGGARRRAGRLDPLRPLSRRGAGAARPARAGAAAGLRLQLGHLPARGARALRAGGAPRRRGQLGRGRPPPSPTPPSCSPAASWRGAGRRRR